MKVLNELLGLAVLSGPLWLILILIPIAIWIAAMVVKRIGRGSAKIVVGVLVFLVLFLAPFTDEVAGRIYFNHLCATEAGVKVYQTIELPPVYWDEHGKAKFYDERNGNFQLEGYSVKYKTGAYSSLFHIDNAGYERVNGQSGQVLGEVTSFRYWGGWMKRNLSPHNTATSCDGGMERSNDLVRQIFVRPKS